MTKKLNNQGFGVIEALVVIIIFGLIITAGWFVLKNRTQNINTTQDTSESITVLGKKIPRASCDKAKALIHEELSGDICYISKFSVDGEEITYVSVDQSESYRDNLEKSCTVDCGGGIPMPGHDNIVRANGAVEYASTDWTNAEPYIDELTGCGLGKFFQLEPLKSQGRFVKDNDKIAVAVSLKDAKISDDYGNQCDVDVKFLHYTSREGQLIDIQHIGVHYRLQGIESCQQQAKPEFCYTAQAAMRNDLQLCNQAVDTQYPQEGTDYCIASMAKRRLDTAICDQLSGSKDRDICRKDTQALKGIFTGKVVVN